MDKQIDMFGAINTNNKIPDISMPEGVKLKPRQLWCPYCSKHVMFVKDKERGIKRCPYCGISDRDYNVKQVNKKWL